MSWITHHEKSERLASQAQTAAHENRRDEALKLYSLAADAEESAIADLDPSKTRTLGISVVSAASLRYKAKQFRLARAVADHWREFDRLPAFARDQLGLLLDEIQEVTPPDDASPPAPSASVAASPAVSVPDGASPAPDTPPTPRNPT